MNAVLFEYAVWLEEHKEELEKSGFIQPPTPVPRQFPNNYSSFLTKINSAREVSNRELSGRATVGAAPSDAAQPEHLQDLKAP